MNTVCYAVFFLNDPATTEIYTLALHDPLPISSCSPGPSPPTSAFATKVAPSRRSRSTTEPARVTTTERSEEHTSELQSRQYLVCRLLLEKKTRKIHVCSQHMPIDRHLKCTRLK